MSSSARDERLVRKMFRCDESLWKEAVRKSKREGTNVSAVIRGALIQYVDSH